MVAPIVPFVVGLLSTYATRKAVAAEKQAAMAVTDYEHDKSVDLLTREYGFKNYLEHIKGNTNSVFPKINSTVYGIQNDKDAFNSIKPEEMWKFEALQKFGNLQLHTKGGDATVTAGNFLAPLRGISNKEWDWFSSMYPDQGKVLGQHITNNILSLDKQFNVGSEGNHSGGHLDIDLFLNQNSWSRDILRSSLEQHSDKIISHDNKLVTVSQDMPDTMFNNLNYILPGMYKDKKHAGKYYEIAATRYSAFHLPQSQKDSSGLKYITPNNAKYAFNEQEETNVGWMNYSDIFLEDFVYADTGILSDVRAKTSGSVFNTDILEGRSINVVRSAHHSNKVLSGIMESEGLRKLYEEGYFFPELKKHAYLINAIGSVANKDNLPGLYTAQGVHMGLANENSYISADNYLKDNFGLGPSQILRYAELGNQGKLAFDTAEEAMVLIDDVGVGGEFMLSLFSGISQGKELIGSIKDLVGDLFTVRKEGQEEYSHNGDAINAQIADIDTQLTTLGTIPTAETERAKLTRETQIRNLTKAKEMLQSEEEFLSKNVSMTKLAQKQVTKSMGTNEINAIKAARIRLLRSSLVFYAAAIFQGEGGKAISDGDRQLVARALQVGAFSTKKQALAALAQFRKGMGRIAAKAMAFGSQDVNRIYGALMLDTIVPSGSRQDSLLGGAAGDAWVIGDEPPSFGGGSEGTRNQQDSVSAETAGNSITFDGVKINLDTLFDADKNRLTTNTLNDTVNYYLSEENLTNGAITVKDQEKLSKAFTLYKNANSSQINVANESVNNYSGYGVQN